MRPSFDETYMRMARTLSLRGTCPRRQVGVILAAPDHTIAGGGYNGAPKGMPHCNESGCIIKDNHCVRVIHAEDNALWYADKSRIRDGVMYVYNAAPCYPCAQRILREGLAEVHCWVPDGTYDDEGWRYLASAGITVILVAEEGLNEDT